MVAAVRRRLGARRVGHTGTLDPFASGLLIVLVGPSTRLARYLVGQTKGYSGVIRLGVTTDSEDPTGTITGSNDTWRNLTLDDVGAAMAKFLGPQRQRPPSLSAKKIAGERAYRRARRGEETLLPEQDVEILTFELAGMDGSDVAFRASVSSGTYVRSMARDLGARLGCGAHLLELRRTHVGSWTVDDATTVDEITPAAIRPAREVVSHLHAVSVGVTDRDSVRHGRSIEAPEVLSGPVAIVAGDELIAVADADGTRLKPRVVLTP